MSFCSFERFRHIKHTYWNCRQNIDKPITSGSISFIKYSKFERRFLVKVSNNKKQLKIS